LSYSPLQLAEAFIQTGELHDALEALDQQIDAHPGDERARRWRAAVLLRLRDEDRLRQAEDDLRGLTAPTARDHVQRSIILEVLGDLEGAVAAMQSARDSQPEDERLAERTLQLLMAQGKLDEAQRLIETRPRTWRWLQWAGDLLVLSGNDIVAIARYGLALAQLENKTDSIENRHLGALRARLLLARADAYRRLEMIEQAEMDYVAAGNLMPDDPMITFKRGLLASLQGDRQRAADLCREALHNANQTLHAMMLAELRENEQYETMLKSLD